MCRPHARSRPCLPGGSRGRVPSGQPRPRPELAACTRHALLPLQTANPHKYAHVACVHVVPGREARLHLLVPAANFTGQESYARAARKFSADLAGLGERKAAISK